MERNEALALVEPHLKAVRFEHTKRVVDTAINLAEQYGVDKQKAELAAVFHDYAKYRDKQEMQRWIEQEALPKDLLDFHHELWHGPVGALLVKREIGITDQSVLDAIRWHTTGRANMTPLEKVVFLADYIEPGRDFPGVGEVRDQAKQDLDRACWMALKNTITFLMSKDATIYPDTFHAYNDLLRVVE
ncbi:bis(5'-nucleosyl)-tetraphosphatase (symmetrical) YqeK [Aquibacillus sediminis]|uniref:bis(5'-nucleosyl)-tetraphosphatase (symmetrical) YqeK n=1 Tax=Aquibacillus sediminis TaxID=2574734 RepID=UPI001108FCB3|nr:bis(5'-nucleosyl)-tetraphosphatase (symmetrical) YqeK [Aquibacillus sediminis]